MLTSTRCSKLNFVSTLRSQNKVKTCQRDRLNQPSTLWLPSQFRKYSNGLNLEGIAALPGHSMLLNHHAHNTEEVPGGLREALDAGFLNIEVDIHPHSPTQLLVGHDKGQKASNLQDLYLRPLAERVKSNEGTVYSPAQYQAAELESSSTPVTLVVDLKEIGRQPPETSFDYVHQALERFAEAHPGVLSSWQGKDCTASLGAVSVMISGHRPPVSHLFTKYPSDRLAILDGREEDLKSDHPRPLMPVISKAWCGGLKALLSGLNFLQFEDKRHDDAKALVQLAHSQGRQVRFWGHDDTPKGWQEMVDLGVDQISTDRCREFQKWCANKIVYGNSR